MVTDLYNNPSIVVIRKEESLTRLQNNIDLAQSQSASESRLYPLLNRIVSDLCSFAKHDSETQPEEGSKELQCHSQALFPGEETDYQVPDCAACVFNSDSLHMFPAFGFEGKALPLKVHEKNWHSAAVARERAMEIFEKSIPQLRQQANYAFKCFKHGPTSYHVFLIVGIFWSLLIFKKQQEEDVRDYIEEMEVAAKQELADIARKLIEKKDQAASLPPAGKRRRITSAPKNPEIVTETMITVPDHLLPQLLYVNEPLVIGNPVENYSPFFLKAVASAMDQNHFVLQPSWFDVPPNINSEPNLSEGIEKLRLAYEQDLRNDMSSEKMALEDHLFSPPQDPNDETYRPPRVNVGEDRKYKLRSGPMANPGTSSNP
ncbi:hypothetical protein EV368DRAFT_81544 [Lentinula lateritia]|nr:hypothetical protein EV368DRAFT_81544 [Lentinula lateritia]